MAIIKGSEFAESHRTALRPVLAVLLGLTLAVLFERYILRQPYLFQATRIAGVYALAGFVGFLAPYATAGWFARPRATSAAREIIVLAVAGLGLSWLVLWEGVHQFGGFDESLLINAAWLLEQGLRPYVDFPETLPPFFHYGSWLCFHIFGWTLSSVAKGFAVFALVALFWTYALLRRMGVGPGFSLLLAVGSHCLIAVPRGFWWYNCLATFSAWLLLLSYLDWLERPGSWLSILSFGAASLLVFLNKPNIWPLLMATYFLLLTSRPHRVRVLACFALLALMVGLLTWIVDFRLASMFRSYAWVGRTRSPLAGVAFQGVGSATIVATLGALVALTGVIFLDQLLREPGRGGGVTLWQGSDLFTLGCFAAFLTGAGLVFSNMESKCTDLALALLAATLLCLRTYPGTPAGPPWLSLGLFGRPGWALEIRGTTIVIALLIAISVSALVLGFERFGIYTIGPQKFHEADLASERPSVPFFRDLRCGKRFLRVLRQIDAVLSQHPRGEVFFGPRMEFAYAAYALPAPRGLPVWWHVGSSYSQAMIPQLVDVFRSRGFDVAVFLKDDYTYVPWEICKYLDDQYCKDQSWSELTVFWRLPGRDRPALQGAPEVKSGMPRAGSTIWRRLPSTEQVDLPGCGRRLM
jgi:hypothetical protein